MNDSSPARHAPGFASAATPAPQAGDGPPPHRGVTARSPTIKKTG